MAQLTKNWQRISTIGITYGEIRTYAKYSSQSMANNTTTYQVRMVYYTYQANGVNFSSATATLDGTQKGYGFTNMPRGETVILDINRTITHNTNGSSPTKNIATRWTASYGGSGSTSANITFPAIKRMATITNAPNFNDEQNPTITYSNPAGNSVGSLQACISLTGATDDIPYREISKTGTSYTFNLTEEERNILRNACTTSNSRIVKFFVRTTVSGTNLYSYIDRTLTIVNANPVFSDFTFEDVNTTTLALTGNNQDIIKGYSKVRVTIPTTNKAVAQKGASMVKYRLSIGDSSVDIAYNDTEAVSSMISNVSSGTINVYAVDSRNNSTMVTKLANREINYEPVYTNINNSSFKRDDNRVGDNGVLTLSGTFWNDNFGDASNSLSVSYRFKKSDSSTWINGTTSIVPTVSENTFSFSGMLASDNVDTTWDLQSSYDLEITVSDELTTSITNYVLASAIPTLSLDKEGVGIMCQYDTSIGGGLQVYGQPLSSYKREAIFVGLQDDPSYTSHSNNTVVKLTKIKNQVGSNFSLSNNAVVVGAGISKVKVQLNLELRYNATTSKYYRIELQKNNASITNQNMYIEIHKQLGENYCVGSGAFIIDVQEGDKLTLIFVTNSGTTDLNRNTGMYVEVLK